MDDDPTLAAAPGDSGGGGNGADGWEKSSKSSNLNPAAAAVHGRTGLEEAEEEDDSYLFMGATAVRALL